MPVTQTLGQILALKDLPLEEKEQISDAIIYSAEHEGEFYSQVSDAHLDANKTSMVFTREYLPEIDKTSDRYKNGLIEGVTPEPEAISQAEFAVAVNEIGWWFYYTNKMLNHSWHDIKARCTKRLSNLFATYHDEKIADAYLKTANTVTSVDLLDYNDLLKINSILYDNGAVPFNGFFKLVVNSAVADAMLSKYKDIITHTTQKEAVVVGEIGELAGFRIIKSRLQAFRKDGSNNYAFVAYGKTKDGEFPVKKCSYDGMAEKIILTPLGGLGDDPLHQRGAIGLYLDGHAFYVANDEVAVAGTVAASSLSSYASDLVVTHVGSDGKFDNAYRNNLTATGGAREIVPNYDYIKMFRYSGSSGTTANTFTLKAKKASGAAWTFDDDGTGTLTAISGNTSVVTASDGVLTTAGTGIASVVIKSVANPNIKTVVTVEVISGNSNGVNPVLD